MASPSLCLSASLCGTACQKIDSTFYPNSKGLVFCISHTECAESSRLLGHWSQAPLYIYLILIGSIHTTHVVTTILYPNGPQSSQVLSQTPKHYCSSNVCREGTDKVDDPTSGIEERTWRRCDPYREVPWSISPRTMELSKTFLDLSHSREWPSYMCTSGDGGPKEKKAHLQPQDLPRLCIAGTVSSSSDHVEPLYPNPTRTHQKSPRCQSRRDRRAMYQGVRRTFGRERGHLQPRRLDLAARGPGR